MTQETVGVMGYILDEDYEMNSTSVVVSSCNKYRYLWDIQLQLFQKYWSECPYPIYMLSETSQLPNKFYGNLRLQNFNTNITPTGPSDWSVNLVKLLKSIDSDYIIYLQEDYVFIRDVDQNKVNKILSFAADNQINYIRFYTSPPGNGTSLRIDEDISIKEITKGTQWRNSLMLSIWKKDVLLDMLESNMGINPWAFEQHSAQFNFDNFYCIDLPDSNSTDVLPFMGIYGSSNNFTFYPEAIQFLQKENITHVEGEPINFNIRL